MNAKKRVIIIVVLVFLSVAIPFLFIGSALAIFDFKEAESASITSDAILYGAVAGAAQEDGMPNNYQNDNDNNKSNITSNADSSVTSESYTSSGVDISIGDEPKEFFNDNAPEYREIYGYAGFIWMSIDTMRNNVEILQLNRYYDILENDACTYPIYELASSDFFDIMDIVSTYEWYDCKPHINAYAIKGCTITVIGNDRVYTYLVFGRDESGRGFVWSFYDYQITYLSEEEYDNI